MTITQAKDLTRDLVPNIVDYRAKTDPDRLYAEYPVSNLTYEEGYQRFTYGEFANIINGVASFLCKTLGPGKDHEVLAYIGPNDVRYPALILGAVKAGYVLFLTSPRNSVAAQESLFTALNCRTILSPEPRPPPVTAILNAFELRVVEVPGVNELLSTKHDHFPFDKTIPESLSEPLFVVHTSGSTGIPKHLVYTHSSGATNMKMMSLDPPPGFDSQDRMYQGKRVYMTFPPFHGAYLVTHLFNALPFGTVVISPTSGAIPSAEGMVEALKKTPVDIGYIVPSIVKELSENPELLDYCAKHLEMLIYCGGDLPQSIGDIVSSKMRLVNQFGASELGLTLLLHPKGGSDRRDWKYCKFHPDLGIDFHEVTDGAYELYVKRDSKKAAQQPTFTIGPNLKNLQEYGSRDLFLRHPSKDKPDLWKWRARADDIIVFLNGEKTNPISMEQYIVSHCPRIAAVLVAGAQRFQASLLVEPLAGKELSLTDRANFIEEMWPIVEKANQDAPSHARIAKSHVLFTYPQKPMLRAGKGTIQRAGTMQMYAKEIEILYADADKMSAEMDGAVSSSPISTDDEHEVSQHIKAAISAITKWQEFKEEDNFYALGMDSLQTITLLRKLKQDFAIPKIALTTIYANPSITLLKGAIIKLTKNHEVSRAADEEDQREVRRSIIKEYQSKVDCIPVPSQRRGEGHSRIVVLTGSTGALGSHILQILLADTNTTHVYCLNRAHNSSVLQGERNATYGLPTVASAFDPSRVTFLTANLSQSQFGIGSDTYTRLQETASLVIHNAWPVNFNLSLESFRPQLDGLINLIDFAASATNSPRLCFISSVGSILSYRNASHRTPEAIIDTNSTAFSNGYSESKAISELILDHAARRLKLDASFARVGQIAGAVNHAGLWNKAEWFPSLVISSLHIGAVPDNLGLTLSNIDWVPIDLLANILVELAESDGENVASNGVSSPNPDATQGARVFHPYSPHPAAWSTLRVTVVEELSSLRPGDKIETVSLHSWIARIKKDAESVLGNGQQEEGRLEAYLKVNPAVKLLDFYEGLLASSNEDEVANTIEIQETLKSSAKLRALGGIKEEWMRKWIKEWIGSGTELNGVTGGKVLG